MAERVRDVPRQQEPGAPDVRPIGKVYVTEAKKLRL